jgi:hypothetical protein
VDLLVRDCDPSNVKPGIEDQFVHDEDGEKYEQAWSKKKQEVADKILLLRITVL